MIRSCAEGSKGYKALLRLLLTRFGNDIINTAERKELQDIYNKNTVQSKKDKNTIFKALDEIMQRYTELNPSYNPTKPNQKGFQTLAIEYPTGVYNKIDSGYESQYFGLGVVDKLKKHFKGDETLLKKVMKALQDDSSSDEEENKELARHIKATKGTDAKIEKIINGRTEVLGKGYDSSNSGFNKHNFATAFSKNTIEANFKNLGGVGFKATRIPVSKVGKGVKLENQENPTYRQFGKYVLHIPHLVNSNTANFKYPSLGSIPSIKPLTVSDDYKDLILDVLQTGKLNKKEFERLPQSEIKHFERVALGAGLVEQLGLKLGNTEEDKTDSKRFELLRGEYLAGNNNQALIKELRLLITKFITNGRIHKNEGLNLLLELSTI
jgi:hypothetical protein